MADWDTFSEEYDRIFLENPQYMETLRRMVAFFPMTGKLKVLDLGCGTGNVTAFLLERLEGDVNVVAVDPSPGMRDKCSARFDEVGAVDVRDGNALDIPGAGEDYDCIFSNLALHHVRPEQRPDCASELFRVLRPGGRLVYADMFCDVDSDPEDPVRVKDIVDKHVGVALYCLDHGAFDMMQVILSTLPADISADGEYLTTGEVWKGLLEDAGFVELELHGVPPEEFGVKIITGRKAAD